MPSLLGVLGFGAVLLGAASAIVALLVRGSIKRRLGPFATGALLLAGVGALLWASSGLGVDLLPHRATEALLVGAFAVAIVALTRRLVSSQEKARRAEAEQLEVVAQTTPDLIARVDPEGRHLYANDAIAEMTGRSRDWFVGRTLQEAGLESEAAERLQEGISKVVATGESERLELELELPRTARPVHLDMRVVPETAPDGTVESAVMIGRDVTERKRMETRLRETSERLDHLIRHTPALIYTLEAEPPYELTWLCDNIEHVLGVPRETLNGGEGSWIEHVHPDDRDRVEGYLDHLATSRDTGTMEYDYRIVLDGRVRWVQERARVLPAENGGVSQIVASSVDITERVEAEEDLRESEDQLRQLAENMDGVAWLASLTDDPSESEILYMSPGFGEMFEIPEDVIRENPMAFLERVPEEDVDDVLSSMLPDGSGDRSFDVEYRIQLDDGTVRHLRTTGAPIHDDDGSPYRLAGLTQDVTKLWETQRALEESNRRLETILTNAPTVLFTFDEEGTITMSRGRGLEALGLEEGELVGANIFDAYGDHPALVEALKTVLEGEPARCRMELDGSHLEVSMLPRTEAGATVGGIGVSMDVTDIVEAQEAVARERHRYEQILKTVPRCIVHIDRDGRFVYANDRAEEILGLEISEVTGRSYNDPAWEIRDLDDEPIPDEELPFRKVRDNGEIVTDQRHKICWPDGTERILSVHGAPIFDEEGEVESTVFSLGDITERLEREQEIERERDLRAALFEQNVDPVLEYRFEDGEAVITSVNEAFLDVFGFDEGEIVDQPISDKLVPPEGRTQHEEFARRSRAGESFQAEVERVTAEGPKTFRLQVVPLDREGWGSGGYAWYTDLSMIRKLEEEEALKARMLDQVGEAVIATDEQGTVTYWNAHAEELYGYRAQEALGRDSMELTVPDTEEGRRQAEEIMETLATGERWTGEFVVERKDGSRFPALVSDTPVLDDGGELVGVLGVSRDISEIKRAQNELVRTTNQLVARNRELQELSQAAAHGFRTPIWDTARYLELLERDAGDKLTDEETIYLQTALGGAHRLHDLVESLQDYLDAATRSPGAGPCNAGEVLDGVLAEMTTEIDERGASVDIQEPAPELAVDASSLAEAFRHLIENALVFSGDEAPRIEVGFERVDDMWVLAVHDEGVGIDHEYQERVFRPFRTLHGPDEGGGTGLGLALCRGTVEAHGGQTWIDSKPGEGTTVYMTLPAPDAKITAPGLQAQDLQTGAGSGDEDGAFQDDVDLFES